MSATILVIDDDADIRYLAEVTLGTLGGYEVVVAASAVEAVRCATSRRPDLILLDEKMPDVDGPATLIRLRAEPTLAAVPVVFLTGMADDDDRRRHLALGAITTIGKPFDPEALVTRVDELIAAAS